MAPTTNKDAYVWTWNSTYQFGDINIGASIYIFLINSQAFKHSFIQKKIFVFLVILGAIIIAKFFIKDYKIVPSH
jgi:hypothetical protein